MQRALELRREDAGMRGWGGGGAAGEGLQWKVAELPLLVRTWGLGSSAGRSQAGGLGGTEGGAVRSQNLGEGSIGGCGRACAVRPLAVCRLPWAAGLVGPWPGFGGLL